MQYPKYGDGRNIFLVVGRGLLTFKGVPDNCHNPNSTTTQLNKNDFTPPSSASTPVGLVDK